MSMDFVKNTYRPTRKDNRFRTSYSLMSQWMGRQGSAKAYIKEPLPQTFAIAMQGNAAFPKRDVHSAGLPHPAELERTVYPLAGSYGQPPVSAQQAAIDEAVPVHLRYNDTAGYDDFHKAYHQMSKQWPSVSYPEFGPPRLRHGRAGGSWRHVKEVLQAGGSRIVFVDGVIRWADGVKIDEIPGGHLIQPQVGEIKSRYMMANKQANEKPSGRFPITEKLAMNEFHRETPVLWRSKTDLPDFTARGKSTL